jgi:hypothetical protein
MSHIAGSVPEDFSAGIDEGAADVSWLLHEGEKLLAGTDRGGIVELDSRTDEPLESYAVCLGAAPSVFSTLQACSADAEYSIVAWSAPGEQTGVVDAVGYAMVHRVDSLPLMAQRMGIASLAARPDVERDNRAFCNREAACT